MVGNDGASLLLHSQIHHSFSIVPTPFANSNTPHKFSPTEAELLHIALQIPNILFFPIASVSLENNVQIYFIGRCAKDICGSGMEPLDMPLISRTKNNTSAYLLGEQFYLASLTGKC